MKWTQCGVFIAGIQGTSCHLTDISSFWLHAARAAFHNPPAHFQPHTASIPHYPVKHKSRGHSLWASMTKMIWGRSPAIWCQLTETQRLHLPAGLRSSESHSAPERHLRQYLTLQECFHYCSPAWSYVLLYLHQGCNDKHCSVLS